MKQKKHFKTISLFSLLGILLCTSLCSCGNNDESKKEEEKEEEHQQEEPTPVIVDTENTLKVIPLEMMGTYGDSCLIKFKNYDILVDAGTYDDKSHVENVLKEYVTDKQLDLLLLTHLHADHIGAMTTTSFFDNLGINITTIVDSGASPTTQTAEKYVGMREAFVNKGTNYYAYKNILTDSSIGTVWDIDKEQGVYMEFFATGAEVSPGGSAKDPNTSSIAFVLNYKNNKWLFAGDLPSTYEKTLINNIKKVDTEYFKESDYVVFKACHHGSKAANGNDILSFIKPDLAFAMAGMNESNRRNSKIKDQHPFLETLQKIKRYTNNVYWTSLNGQIVFSSEGEEVRMQGCGRTRDYYHNGSVVSREEEKNKTIFETRWYSMLIGQ